MSAPTRRASSAPLNFFPAKLRRSIAIAPNWSAKVEYNFLGLDDRTFIAPFGFQRLAGDTFFVRNRDIQMVKVGINYRFNWSGYGNEPRERLSAAELQAARCPVSRAAAIATGGLSKGGRGHKSHEGRNHSIEVAHSRRHQTITSPPCPGPGTLS